LHFLCRLTERQVKLVNGGRRGIAPEGVLDHLSRFKSYTTNRSWRLGLHGQLWQKSSYDRVFDLDWPFEEVAQYVLENPVRRGLVNDWNEWEHSVIVDPWWQCKCAVSNALRGVSRDDLDGQVTERHRGRSLQNIKQPSTYSWISLLSLESPLCPPKLSLR
jgi:hypothetical protein